MKNIFTAAQLDEMARRYLARPVTQPAATNDELTQALANMRRVDGRIQLYKDLHNGRASARPGTPE
jgi:hypothetical protein